MSYDLAFLHASPTTTVQLSNYFSANPWYEITGSEVVYENEDTGVYYVFTLGRERHDPRQQVATLHLNYFRPHFFGLEAAYEIQLFTRHFRLTVSDPQIGTSNILFSEQEFIRGWNSCNKNACQDMRNQGLQSESIYYRPTEQLDAIWRWNHNRALIQKVLGDNIFIPRIFWLVLEGKLISSVVWPDGINALIPEVDYVYLPRDKLAPKNGPSDNCLIETSQLYPLLSQPESTGFPLQTRTTFMGIKAGAVEEYIRALQPNQRALVGVAHDKVLNCEFV